MQIEKIASDSAASLSLSDSDEYVRIPRKKKAKTGVLRSNKSPKRAHSSHHGIQRYCVLCKKLGIPARKYMSHSSKDFSGVRTKQSINDGLVGTMVNRTDAVKQYQKSENKWKKDMKYLRKQNNMIYSIANKYGSRRDIKKINNIRIKASKKNSDSSSDYSDSDSSLASDSSWETYRQPSVRKDMNRLYHLVTYNLKNYKDQRNESINSEPTFYTSGFNLSSGTSYPLPVVTFSLRIVK